MIVLGILTLLMFGGAIYFGRKVYNISAKIKQEEENKVDKE